MPVGHLVAPTSTYSGIALELHRGHQGAAGPGGDEQHRHEEQAAAQEHRGEQAVLAIADQVPDDGDEPQEGNAGERGEIDADERDLAGVLSQVEVADLCRGAVAGGMIAQKQDRGDEEQGESESGDSCRARRLEGPVAASMTS
jgi:hypothetical protein